MPIIALRTASPWAEAGLRAALTEDGALSLGRADEADMLVAEVGDAHEALELYESPGPLLVLLGDELEAVAERALADHQAIGLLGRHAPPMRLRAAVHAVLGGLFVFDASMSLVLPARGFESSPLEPLTARELEVLDLLVRGLRNRDIAQALGISQHTAKFHVGQILAKLEAATRAEAVSVALRLGLAGV
jgi:DNA-binding NarL/FixJ family response regulator